MKIVYLLRSFWSSSATGFIEYFEFGNPSGRPRWDMRTKDLAPFSRI